MEIKIYEPEKLVIPGVTEKTKLFKCTIQVFDVRRIDNKYIVALNNLELEKAVKFINDYKGLGMHGYRIQITNINKWIESSQIMH